MTEKVALVTGSAKRVGAATVKALHAQNVNVLVHYSQSKAQAEALVAELNAKRPASAACFGTPLDTQSQCEAVVQAAVSQWGRLDIVVNNASSFFPTPIGLIDEAAVENLFTSNFKAPLFVSQAAAGELSKHHGVIINLVDIHGLRPHKEHSVYCGAKAALIMLTKSMAKELAPTIRVNGIAPGAILWPEDGSVDSEEQKERIADIPLGRCGSPADIAELVVYLSSDAAAFITGEIIKVDGGRSI